MNFGEAIKRAKNGEKIRRAGWNGKNQYVELATCISYKNADGYTVNAIMTRSATGLLPLWAQAAYR